MRRIARHRWFRHLDLLALDDKDVFLAAKVFIAPPTIRGRFIP
jgi:hypothetical protein